MNRVFGPRHHRHRCTDTVDSYSPAIHEQSFLVCAMQEQAIVDGCYANALMVDPKGRGLSLKVENTKAKQSRKIHVVASFPDSDPFISTVLFGTQAERLTVE